MKKNDVFKGTLNFNTKNKSAVLILEDETRIGFIKDKRVVFALPREKFTDKICNKVINGKKYFAFTFANYEWEVILLSLLNYYELLEGKTPSIPKRGIK